MRGAVLASLALTLAAGTAQAELACGTSHVVPEGQSLRDMAQAAYGDAGKWTLIHYANAAALGVGGGAIGPGMTVFVPCLGSSAAVVSDPAPLQQPDAELRFVTMALPPLLTDPEAPGGGMLTELVNAAMEATPNPVPYAVIWDREVEANLLPAPQGQQADMGFPLARPDCAAAAAASSCSGLHWSDPLFVLPVQLFVTQGGGMSFASDEELEDKTLCLAEGDEAPWLDGNGRNLLADGDVTVTRAADFNACLDLLVAGDVDAVPQDIFLGVDQVYQRGLRGQVTALERPIGTESLHVVISKAHWRGTTHLYRVNAGLAAIKASGRYDEIINRHLGQYMARIRG